MTIINIDGENFDTNDFSPAAKESLLGVQFVDTELHRVRTLIAVLQNARTACATLLHDSLRGEQPPVVKKQIFITNNHRTTFFPSN